jgi:TetR/AcrR family transcriptional regulator, transcriptional repressor of aconitase
MIIYLSSCACYLCGMPAKPGPTSALSEPSGATDRSTTHSRILAAAERLFAEDGYAGVSMPAIAKASGITAGAIYKHFDSKEDLFFEVVRRAVHAAPVAAQSGDAAADLPRIVAAYTTRRFKRLRQLAIEIHSASTKHPKVRRLLQRALESNTADLRNAILGAQQKGTLDPSLDAESLAHAVLVFVMGLMHLETLLPGRVDDAAWRTFLEARIGAILGAR